MSFYDFVPGGIAFAGEISKNHLSFNTLKAFNGKHTGSGGQVTPGSLNMDPQK